MIQPLRAALVLGAPLALLALGPAAHAGALDRHPGSAHATATAHPGKGHRGNGTHGQGHAGHAGHSTAHPAHPHPTRHPSAHPTHPAAPHPTHPQAPGAGTHGQGHHHGSKGDPKGNNGVVKIASLGDIDRIPNNTAHPGCSFEVQWYGFDAGADVVSTVSFTPQAPTKDVTIAVDGPTRVPVGQDATSGAGTPTGLDAVQDYTLSFSGGAPAKQGYHVRLTVSTPRSLGNDTKTKVFWVAPCAPGAPSATATDAVAASTPTGTGKGSAGGTTTTTGTNGTRAAAAGSATSARVSADSPAVPTAIDAGAARHGLDAWVHSPWPLALVGLGAVLAAVALGRARRRA